MMSCFTLRNYNVQYQLLGLHRCEKVGEGPGRKLLLNSDASTVCISDAYEQSCSTEVVD